MIKKYYGIVRGTPPYVVVEAERLAIARAILTEQYGADKLMLVKRASPEDLNFIEWCKGEDETKATTDGSRPGDTGEQGLAPSGPRC